MATLTVRRDKEWADKLRKYRILLDGTEIGRLGQGDLISQQVTAGPHSVEAKIDWCGSKPFCFVAGSGDIVILVRSGLRGWDKLLILYYIIFDRHGYLTLHLISEE